MSDNVENMPIDFSFRRMENIKNRAKGELLEFIAAQINKISFVMDDGIKGKFSTLSLKDGVLMFDAILENYPLDHIEFTIKCTGGGGAI